MNDDAIGQVLDVVPNVQQMLVISGRRMTKFHFTDGALRLGKAGWWSNIGQDYGSSVVVGRC